MGAPRNFTKKDILEAIKGSGGIVSTIAKKLDCRWSTANKYINEWPETKQAIEDETQTILDMCEGAIYKSVKEGNTQDAKWVLATKGKLRGFTERQEISGPNGGPIQVDNKPDLSKLSTEELKNLESILAKTK
jgi:hypothetical protein